MKQLSLVSGVLAAVLAAQAAFGQAHGAAAAAPAPAQTAAGPPAGGESASTRSADPGLEAQLDAARRRLDEAAREVARLSAERGQAVIRRYSTFVEAHRRAIIGVQLDTVGRRDGVRVLDVSPGGPAAEAGIRAGDVITAVNDTEVKGTDAARRVVRIVGDVMPDTTVRIRVLRDGKPREFVVTARPGPGDMFFFRGGPPAPPEPPAQAFGPALPARPMFLMEGPLASMELATLTPRLGAYFGTDKGVLVVRAPAAGALKLEDGDVILSIDGRAPASGPHATRILASYQPGEAIHLEIMRERKTRKISTTMPEGVRRGGKTIILRRGMFDAPPPPRPPPRDAGVPHGDGDTT